MAQALDITQPYVSQMARGLALPGVGIVERMVQVYSLPRDEWLSLAGHDTRERAAQDESIQSNLAALHNAFAVEQAREWLRLRQGDPEAGQRFGSLLKRLTEGNPQRDEELDTLFGPAKLWLFAGFIPPPFDIAMILKHLDLSESEAAELFTAAGQSGWDAAWVFLSGLADVAQRLGGDSVLTVFNPDALRSLSGMTPKQIAQGLIWIHDVACTWSDAAPLTSAEEVSVALGVTLSEARRILSEVDAEEAEADAAGRATFVRSEMDFHLKVLTLRPFIARKPQLRPGAVKRRTISVRRRVFED